MHGNSSIYVWDCENDDNNDNLDVCVSDMLLSDVVVCMHMCNHSIFEIRVCVWVQRCECANEYVYDKPFDHKVK